MTQGNVTPSIGGAIDSLSIFRQIDAESARIIAESARIVQHVKGTVFLRQGQKNAVLYVMISGWGGAVKGNRDGNQTVTEIFGHGMPLPAMAHGFSDDGVTCDYMALSDLVMFGIPSAIWRQVLGTSPMLAANYMDAINARCQRLQEHIENSRLLNAEQRVGHFLLQLRDHSLGREDIIDLPFDKGAMASYMSMTPETFSRSLQSFKQEGFTIERHSVQVPYRDALCDYCNESTMKSCRYAHSDQCTHSASNDDIAMG